MDLNTYAALDRPLTAAEVDANWNAIKGAYDDMAGGFVRLAGFVISGDGANLIAIGTDGNPMAEIPLPAPFLNAGAWSEGNPYTNRSLVSHEGVTYLCVIPHQSGEEFYDDLDNGFWLPLGGGGGGTAADVEVAVPTIFGLVETGNVQAALEELEYHLAQAKSQNNWLTTQVADLNDTVADLETRLAALEGA